MSHLTPDKLPIGYTVTRKLAESGFDKNALRKLDRLPKDTRDFVLCLAFGQDAFDVATMSRDLAVRSEAPAARNALLYGLGSDFETFKKRYIKDWQTEVSTLTAPDPNVVHHQDRLYQMSRAVLLMHEDQTYDGAFVASLSIPWGDNTGDHAGGGYHLVWPRDMSQTIGALFYAGEYEAALRGLRFLAVSQQNNGSLSPA